MLYDQLYRQQCNEEVEFSCCYSHQSDSYEHAKQLSAGVRYFLTEHNQDLLKEALPLKKSACNKLKKSCDFFKDAIVLGKNRDMVTCNFLFCCIPCCLLFIDRESNSDGIYKEVRNHGSIVRNPFILFKQFIERYEVAKDIR